MTWDDIVKVMRVDVMKELIVRLAISEIWWLIIAILGVFILIGAIYLYRRHSNKSDLRPKVDGMSLTWIITVLATIILARVFLYTKDANTVLKAMNTSSVWQLSPQGVTILLGQLQSLFFIQTGLFLTGLIGIVTSVRVYLMQKNSSKSVASLPTTPTRPTQFRSRKPLKGRGKK